MELDRIKELAIISMFSDDILMELLVLKGGNALDIAYNLGNRASMDFDFSIETEFPPDQFLDIKERIIRAIKMTFESENIIAFDITINEKPKTITEDMADFWGGYNIEFKVIDSKSYHERSGDIDSIRRNAFVIGAGQQKKVNIDISKFEYCKNKQRKLLSGYTIYVYMPELLVIEKLRAICQQMKEYAQYVRNPTMSPRAKDFFDVYTTIQHFKIDLKEPDNIELIRLVFEAKRVPLNFLNKIKDYKEFHLQDFVSVKDTVKPGIDLKDFDFYFDYVVGLCEDLKSTGII